MMTQAALFPTSEGTLVLDTAAAGAEQAALLLVRCAELVEAPGRMQTYRLTALSLWQAAAGGMTAPELQTELAQLSGEPLPPKLRRLVDDAFSRVGRLWLDEQAGQLLLHADDPALLERLAAHEAVQAWLSARMPDGATVVPPEGRGLIKAALARAGYPVDDRAPLKPGAHLALELRERTRSGPFGLRHYQQQAVSNFLRAGSGVVVLPCGAGKTAIGMGALAALQARALVLCPSITALRQWRAELLDKTTLQEEQIGEWSGERKQLAPVTLATYQVLAQRQRGHYRHFQLLGAEDWGLVVYDEVHLLPAPIFRMAAELQSRRRLGLTATLVREDGRERDVFSLIGPQRFALPWRELERQGWIAPAHCTELRVALPEAERRRYALAEQAQEQARVAAENPLKLELVRSLVARHSGERILVIGQYLDQVAAVAQLLGAPLITGRTAQPEREQLYGAFRSGGVTLLVVSKVANVAVDLPDAAVAIQISGAFGSRQEEAQRLGRILRPKADGRPAHFYTLVSEGTREEDDAARRQRFLVEQGYRYQIVPARRLQGGEAAAPAAAASGR